MKGTGKFALIFLVAAGLLIIYVHAHVALFQVSYSIAKNNRVLNEKSEEYRHLKYEVDQLTAPGLLESRMKDFDLQLALPKEIKVIVLPSQDILSASMTDAPPVSMNVLSEGLTGLLGHWVKVAQAKTDRS